MLFVLWLTPKGLESQAGRQAGRQASGQVSRQANGQKSRVNLQSDETFKRNTRSRRASASHHVRGGVRLSVYGARPTSTGDYYVDEQRLRRRRMTTAAAVVVVVVVDGEIVPINSVS
jgi:hypothetical protein